MVGTENDFSNISELALFWYLNTFFWKFGKLHLLNLEWNSPPFTYKSICIKECGHSLTHLPNTTLAILWKIESQILVYWLVLRPWLTLRKGFAKFPRHEKHVSEHNSASNYLMIKKLCMGWLDMNTNKFISTISKLLTLKMQKRGNH